MKKFKRLMAIMLSAIMMLTLMAGCGSTSGGSSETGTSGEPTDTKHTIAVVFSNYSATYLAYQNYFDTYLGPEFNCEFMYSEAISETDDVLSFIETAYASGAEAVIDFATNSEDTIEPKVAKCAEYNKYYAVNFTITETDLSGYPNFVTASDVSSTGRHDTFYELTKYALSDGEPHNFVIFTGGAIYGGDGHIKATMGILEALSDELGITYEDELYDITQYTSITELNTGCDTKIAIMPLGGSRTDNMYSILKDGEYDVVMDVAGLYSDFMTPINDVEEKYNMDIKLFAETSVSDTTLQAFTSKDSQGNSVLNGSALKNGGAAGLLFAATYNALNGDIDKIKPTDGSILSMNADLWEVIGLDEYEKAEVIDTDGEHWTYTVDDIKDMIYAYNNEVNADYLVACGSKSAFDQVCERNGL